MEMKARQLNNRRSKTKSYSPACLRTVQIESKTRRGNCEEPRLEIPPTPALSRPRSLPRSPSALLPPRPSSPVFVSSLCNPEVEAEGGLQPPAGRCGSSPPLFIGGQRGFHHFSEKSISFSLPHIAAAGEQQAAAHECVARTEGHSLFTATRLEWRLQKWRARRRLGIWPPAR